MKYNSELHEIWVNFKSLNEFLKMDRDNKLNMYNITINSKMDLSVFLNLLLNLFIQFN